MNSRLSNLPPKETCREDWFPPPGSVNKDSGFIALVDPLRSVESRSPISSGDAVVDIKVWEAQPAMMFIHYTYQMPTGHLWQTSGTEPHRFWYGGSGEMVWRFAATQSHDPLGILGAFVDALRNREVAEVECVVGFREDGFLSIWTIVNDANRATRMRIYDAELEVEGQYQDARIAFHLVRRRDRLLDEIVSFPRDRILLSLQTANAH